MKRAKRYLFIGIVALSMLLSGCGTALYELTAEEEELIVQYAAYAVAKHNIQQKDGMSGVYVAEEDLASEETENSENEETESESESESETDGDVISGEDETIESEDGISLAEIIGHGTDLTIACTGNYIADNYMEGDAYSVDAAEGKTFYVMKFKLTNTTGQEVKVDNTLINPIFKLVSGSVSVNSEVTFLTTDFSTYQGTIKAGESVETILLFEVSKDSAGSIKEPSLTITIDNVTKTVKL